MQFFKLFSSVTSVLLPIMLVVPSSSNSSQCFQFFALYPVHPTIPNSSNWINFLQLQYCDGKPLPSHYPLFPTFNAHNIRWGGTLSTPTVNDLLSRYAKEAGLSCEALTSHCFRRGGVQYWFLHAPVTQRWSLDLCRQWGGWASGEDVSRIFRPCALLTLYTV